MKKDKKQSASGDSLYVNLRLAIRENFVEANSVRANTRKRNDLF